jgi:NADPH:quinone reductase-like Zn-dependent oxidoreductase
LDDLNRLMSIECIKALRARFARSMDTKDWKGLGDCLTEDCYFDCTQEAGVDEPWRGVEEIVGNIRRSFANAVTVHHAHMPEIEITSPTTARAIWAMEDQLRFPGLPTVELVGYGHYHEEYRVRSDGRWRISSFRLTRLRSDVERRFPPGYAPPAAPERNVHPSRTIRAVRVRAYGGPDVLTLDKVPEPLPGGGEVLVRVAGAAINPIDLKLRAGVFDLFMPLAFPAQIGGDLAGTVESIGSGVEGIKVGDRVMGMINPMANGAYAEKVAVAAALLTRVPLGLDLTDAAAIPMAGLTGCQLIETGLVPEPGDRVLVTGAAGAVGRAAVYAAAAAGARVIAGIRPGREGDVADLPISSTVDINDVAAVRALGLLDGIADTVGGLTVERLAPCVKRGGRIASVVSPPPVPDEERGVAVVPVWVSFDAVRLSVFAEKVASGEYQMPIARKLPLASAADAHRQAERSGRRGKIVLITQS